MGLGIIPPDEGVTAVANVFVEPLGLALRPFFVFLGVSKILGVLSIWGKGPLNKKFGIAGLMCSASCAAYGHFRVGDSILPPLFMLVLLSALAVLDAPQTKETKNE